MEIFEIVSMLNLLLGAFIIAWAPILVKVVTDVGPASIGATRTLVAFVLFFLIARKELLKKSFWQGENTKHWAYTCLAAGVFFGLDLTLWHISIFWIGAGLATVLANSQVFYMGVYSIVRGQQKLDLRYLAALLLALCGILLLFEESLNLQPQQFWGLCFGVMTGGFYAGYLLFLRWGQARHPQASVTSSLTLASFSSTLTMGLIAVLRSENFQINQKNILSLVGLGGLVHVLGWLLIARGLKHVRPSLVGISLLLQPLLASVLASLIFDEALSKQQIFSMTLVLAAISLESSRTPPKK